mgnify:CR=1 FL=1
MDYSWTWPQINVTAMHAPAIQHFKAGGLVTAIFGPPDPWTGVIGGTSNVSSLYVEEIYPIYLS